MKAQRGEQHLANLVGTSQLALDGFKADVASWDGVLGVVHPAIGLGFEGWSAAHGLADICCAEL